MVFPVILGRGIPSVISLPSRDFSFNCDPYFCCQGADGPDTAMQDVSSQWEVTG